MNWTAILRCALALTFAGANPRALRVDETQEHMWSLTEWLMVANLALITSWIVGAYAANHRFGFWQMVLFIAGAAIIWIGMRALDLPSAEISITGALMGIFWTPWRTRRRSGGKADGEAVQDAPKRTQFV